MTMLRLLQQLLPLGAYSEDPTAHHLLELATWADGLQAADDDLDALEPEVFPDTALQTLPDWERILGLTPASTATTADRQAAVLAHWQLQPTLNPGHIQATMEGVSGASVAIIELCQIWGEWVWGDIWVGDWVFRFYVAVDQADVVVLSLLREPLQVLADRLKPAHTQALVVADAFVWGEEWGWSYSLWSTP
jgi:uncharacterized protein YmfQ (DUF2313 family)